MSEPLWQWTIYERPSDYPDNFVVRAWYIFPGKAVPARMAIVVDSLEEAREMIPEGCVCLGRAPTDDEAIVEVWL